MLELIAQEVTDREAATAFYIVSGVWSFACLLAGYWLGRRYERQKAKAKG